MNRRSILAALAIPLILGGLPSCGGGPAELLIAAALAKFVSGIVRDSKTSQPLPSTNVKLTFKQSGEVKNGTTGADGGFTFDQLASGEYEFVFDRLGYQQLTIDLAVTGTIDSLSVTLLPNEITTTNVSITAAPPTVQMGSTAQYTAQATSNGTPLTVFWTVEDPTVGIVNADGKFTPLKPGATKVYAQLGPTRFSAQITATDNQAAGALFGIVTAGANHEPVGGATVTANGMATTSSADGTFTFENVAPGNYTVNGAKSGLSGSATAAVVANAGAKVSLELK